MTTFDVAKVPFSRRGSYFSISYNNWGATGKGLFLHSHYTNSPQVLRIELTREGTVVEHEVQATPTLLTLKPKEGGGQVEIVVAGNDSIRLRGKGVNLRLEMVKERWNTATEYPQGVWGINYGKHYVQIAIETLAGQRHIDTLWQKGQGFCWESANFLATFEPDGTSGFEVAIDSYISSWVRPERPSFDAELAAVEREYAEFRKGLPAVAPEFVKARDLALYVNWSAILAPAGNLTRETMFMSKYSMCNVYGWDHAFNAMAHCTHNPRLAWDQLFVLAERTDEFGKFPSSMNRSEIRYAIYNAPIQGWALRRMWNENPAMMTRERLEEAYKFISAWSDWITRFRIWPDDEMPVCVHGFDGGWDNSSIFDQGVPVIGPDIAAYFILQLETLGDLADALHRPAEAQQWRQRSQRMNKALIDQLWKNQRFVGIIRPSRKVVDCESLVTCMPMVLGKRLPPNVIKPLVARIREFLTPHGLATEKLNSPNYVKTGYWRGPIWAPSTMLVTHGLEEVGERELANTIKRAFCAMCAQSGFAENFNAETGAGQFCPAYTWTSSVYMIFAHELSKSA